MGYNIAMLSLQRKCIKACDEKYKPSKRPTMPGELDDDENDPHHPRPSGASPRPPFKPFLVSLIQFLYDYLMLY